MIQRTFSAVNYLETRTYVGPRTSENALSRLHTTRNDFRFSANAVNGHIYMKRPIGERTEWRASVLRWSNNFPQPSPEHLERAHNWRRQQINGHDLHNGHVRPEDDSGSETDCDEIPPLEERGAQ